MGTLNKIKQYKPVQAFQRGPEPVGAGWEWLAEAERAVLAVAKSHECFTTDDVWKYGLRKPAEPRALGPVMRSLALRGLIESIGYQKTIQVSRHRAPVAVWKWVTVRNQFFSK